jgi:hypothetical protein
MATQGVTANGLARLLLAALAMSFGWGFRGDYGHEAGAMVPGALVALAVCLLSGREDWWERAPLIAMLGAIGWALGGQMSYGKIIGYTAHSSLPDVTYGYGCLLVIGALWGGIGGGILALGLTRARSELERFASPLVAIYVTWLALDFSGVTEALSSRWPLNDTDWVAAASALIVSAIGLRAGARSREAFGLIFWLATGWWLGLAVLTLGLGLRMTPPRGDNWAGCVGLAAALVSYLWRTRNRAALMFAAWSALAGGIGFALGDFWNMLGRAQWGPVGSYESLHRLDYWKWMEQFFGLAMGFGVACAAMRLTRLKLAPVANDEMGGPMRWVAPLFLLLVMQWENLFKNVRNWSKAGSIREGLLGLEPQGWFLLVALMLSALVVAVLIRHRRGGLAFVPAGSLGRAQLLFLVLVWVAVLAAFTQAFPILSARGPLLVHVTFWLTAGVCSFLAVCVPTSCELPAADEGILPGDPIWHPGWKHWTMWAGVLALIPLLAKLSVGSHAAPLPGSHLRFSATNSMQQL